MNLLSRTLTTAAAVIPTLAALAGTAAAGADDTWQRQTLPIAGASFTCAGTTLTAPDGTDGTITFAYHLTTAADGSVRDNGRGTPNDATLDDPDGNVYRLVGAFSFTDTYDPATGDAIAGTVSDQFTVVDATGGLVGRVGTLEHLDRDGTLRDLQLGDCTDNNN
jgi:hypothetical protein